MSAWNILTSASREGMFDGAVAIQSLLRNVLGVESFFDGEYCLMAADARRKVFGRGMKRYRRKHFVLFLVPHNYLYTREHDYKCNDCSTADLGCASLFDRDSS